MSQENLEVVRRMSETFTRRAFDEFLETLAPDVEWVPIMAALEGRVYRGHSGVRQWIEDLATDWEIFETYQEELRPIGNRVLVFGRWHARARASRVELDGQQATWLIELKGGRITRLQTYTDRVEALQAAGLSE
jgi:ketosteroid isomerase-like protein